MTEYIPDGGSSNSPIELAKKNNSYTKNFLAKLLVVKIENLLRINI